MEQKFRKEIGYLIDQLAWDYIISTNLVNVMSSGFLAENLKKTRSKKNDRYVNDKQTSEHSTNR